MMFLYENGIHLVVHILWRDSLVQQYPVRPPGVVAQVFEMYLFDVVAGEFNLGWYLSFWDRFSHPRLVLNEVDGWYHSPVARHYPFDLGICFSHIVLVEVIRLIFCSERFGSAPPLHIPPVAII